MPDASFLRAGMETAAYASRVADKFRPALSPHSRVAERGVLPISVDVRAGAVFLAKSAVPVCRARLILLQFLRAHVLCGAGPQNRKTRRRSPALYLPYFGSPTCRELSPTPRRCDPSLSPAPRQKFLGTELRRAGAQLRHACRFRAR